MNRLSKSILTAAAILLTTLCRLTPAPAQDVFSALQGQGGVLVADPFALSVTLSVTGPFVALWA